MAGGWSKDGAVQDQIDASIEDAVSQARSTLPQGESLTHCIECDAEIPEARRKAIQGVQYCIQCQSQRDQLNRPAFGFNRRGGKGSQLK
jgi:phage/conjugal plasmid C-4 type zinc finger TraR family protein